MTLVSKVSDRVLAMNQGAVLAVGTPAEVQADPGVDRGLPRDGRRREQPAEGCMTDVVLQLLNVESAYGPIKAIRGGVSLKVEQAGEIATVCWEAPAAPARPPS